MKKDKRNPYVYDLLYMYTKRQRIPKGQSTKGQSKETGNIGYTTKRKKTKIKHNTICVGHHYTQTNTNNVNKISALLQTIEGKDEPNIILCGNRN